MSSLTQGPGPHAVQGGPTEVDAGKGGQPPLAKMQWSGCPGPKAPGYLFCPTC